MRINLACKDCGRYSNAHVSDLCRIWEAQYLALQDELDENFDVIAQTECAACGSITRYDTPIFRHIFRLIFDEYRADQ